MHRSKPSSRKLRSRIKDDLFNRLQALCDSLDLPGAPQNPSGAPLPAAAPPAQNPTPQHPTPSGAPADAPLAHQTAPYPTAQYLNMGGPSSSAPDVWGPVPVTVGGGTASGAVASQDPAESPGGMNFTQMLMEGDEMLCGDEIDIQGLLDALDRLEEATQV